MGNVGRRTCKFNEACCWCHQMGEDACRSALGSHRAAKEKTSIPSAGKEPIPQWNGAGMTRGWRGDDSPTFLAQAPHGGILIPERQ